jgi:hypothetical protein
MPTNGNGIWKTTALMLASALVSGVGAWLVLAHNVVTKEELPALVQVQNPYTQDAKDIKDKLDEMKARLDKLDEHILHQDDHIIQMGQDVANIATKAGVTAHPITSPNGEKNK